MRQKKKLKVFWKKGFRRTAAFALLFSMLVGLLSPFRTQAADTVDLTYEKADGLHYQQYHGDSKEKLLDVKIHKVNGEWGYCIAMWKGSNPGTGIKIDITKYLPGKELVYACLAQKHIFEDNPLTKDLPKAERYAYTQCMVWWIQRDHILDGTWRQFVVDGSLSESQQRKLYSDLEEQIAKEAPKYEGDGVAYRNTEVEDDQEIGLLFAPKLKTGYVKLRKTSENPSISSDNLCYTLEGAVYGVYSDADCTKKVTELTTDKNGNTDTAELEIGDYWIQEITAPEGFYLDDTIKKVEVTAGKTATVSFEDIPANDPLGLSIVKRDVESKGTIPLGSATLEGAQFSVQYYDGYYEKESDLEGKKPKKEWIFETQYDEKMEVSRLIYDDAHKVSGAELYKNTSGSPVLPLGTYVIWESKAPEGYLLNENAVLTNQDDGTLVTGGKKFITQVKKDSREATQLVAGNEYSRYDRVIRGDFEFTKIGEDGERLSGIEFEIISDTTGERHTFVTDKNGYYSSSSNYLKHEEKNGLWFGQYKEEKSGEIMVSKVNNDWGALPYDTYTLNELKSEANEGLVLLKNIKLTVFKDGFQVDMGTLTDQAVTLSTMAQDEETKTQYAAADANTTLKDTVSYAGVQKNVCHTLRTILVDCETGKVLLDKDGKEVTAVKEFTPKSKTGIAVTEVTFDASELAGKDVVFFEELYLGKELTPENLIASHCDIESKEQTIHFPSIKTKVKDKDSGTQVVYAGENVTIIDTVSYTNLPVGKEMKLEGIQMLKSNGEPAKDADGKEIKGTATFVPKESSGETTVEFTFNASNLGGETLVTFETLTWNGLTIEHKDIEDKEQSMYISEVDLEKTADKETYEVGDTIHYTITATPKEGTSFTNAVIEDKDLTKGVEIEYSSIRINGNEYPLEEEQQKKVTETGEDKTNSLDETEKAMKNPEIHLVKTEKSFKVLVNPLEQKIVVTFDGIVKDKALQGKKIHNTAVLTSDQSPEQKDKVTVKVPKKETVLKGVQTGLKNHSVLFAGIAVLLLAGAALLLQSGKLSGKGKKPEKHKEQEKGEESKKEK